MQKPCHQWDRETLDWDLLQEGFLAGWVARTRPLAGPLSPRGPQPVIIHVRKGHRAAQWAASVNCPGTRVLVPGGR